MTLTLTIVRHGNTFGPYEPPRRIGARTDLPLTQGGEAQAWALGRAFADDGRPFDRVLASPLRRTRRTAELILDHLPPPPPIEICDWLAEIDHGPDENRREEEVLARLGAETLARWHNALIAPPGWRIDASMRFAAWRDLLASGAGHLLLVTSAGAARFALQAHPDLARRARSLGSPKLRTGAWGRIAVSEGRMEIEAWDVRPGDTIPKAADG